MQAQNILLTHFSQRYPKLPPPPPPPQRLDPTDSSALPTSESRTVVLALDHADFRIGDMWKFKHYLPALERHFSELSTTEDGEGEELLEAMGARMEVDPDS